MKSKTLNDPSLPAVASVGSDGRGSYSKEMSEEENQMFEEVFTRELVNETSQLDKNTKEEGKIKKIVS